MSKFEIPTELIKAIASNNLVIFVGAGLSFNLKNIHKQKIGGWNDLIKAVLEDNNSEDAKKLLPLVGDYEPIDVLNLVEKNQSVFPKDAIYDFIKSFLDLGDENDLTLHQKIFQLSNKIITTNYDTAFEQAERQLRKYVAYKDKTHELSKWQQNKKPTLLKLHGCYENTKSMVLFPSNYRSLYEDNGNDASYLRTALENTILNKTILFIGAGMGDFQINSIFKKVKELQSEFNRQHFIITKDTLDSSLDFLIPLTINDYAEIPNMVDELLKIKQATESEKDKVSRKEHDKAVAQIQTLNEQIEKSDLEHLSKDENIEYQKKLLEREAVNYFIKGQDCHTNNELENAISHYQKATILNPDYDVAYNNWGLALSEIANEEVEEVSNGLFQEAFEKFNKSIQIKVTCETYFSWGYYLSAQAIKRKDESPDTFQKISEKYQKATESNTNYFEAYISWGKTLCQLAKNGLTDDVNFLFEESIAKFQIAIDIQPDSFKAYSYWGFSLLAYALTKTGKDAEVLVENSFKKCQKSIEINPDNYFAYECWGVGLLYLSRLEKSEEHKQIISLAKEKCEKAFQLGGRAYNLACCYALEVNKKEAFHYLEISLRSKELSSDINIREDEDWQSFKDDSDFDTLLKKYGNYSAH